MWVGLNKAVPPAYPRLFPLEKPQAGERVYETDRQEGWSRWMLTDRMGEIVRQGGGGEIGRKK